MNQNPRIMRLVHHLEMAHQKPLKVILNQLFDEELTRQAVAARLGLHLALLDALTGLCDTKPLEELINV